MRLSQTSPCDTSVVAGPADYWVPLSSHPCLPLPNGIPTGPGPSLPARFAARGFISTTTRSAILVPSQPLPTHGYRPGLLGELSSPGTDGLLQLPHPPSLHVAADTPPVRTAVSDSFRSALAAFARYRPSRPPELRVTRLRLRSLHVATWSVAHPPFKECCRRASPSCFRATAPPVLRGLSLLASVGLSPTG